MVNSFTRPRAALPLVFTRLCLESLLLNTARHDVEIIVVDNASSDMTPGRRSDELPHRRRRTAPNDLPAAGGNCCKDQRPDFACEPRHRVTVGHDIEGAEEDDGRFGTGAPLRHRLGGSRTERKRRHVHNRNSCALGAQGRVRNRNVRDAGDPGGTFKTPLVGCNPLRLETHGPGPWRP